MTKIKMRETVKNIKALDKVVISSERMKDAFVRTRDSTERTSAQEHDSPNGYAIDNARSTAKNVVQGTVMKAGNQSGRVYHKARDMRRSYKETKQAADGVKDTANGVRGSAQGVKDTAKGVWEPARSIGETTKDARQSQANVRDIVYDASRSTKSASDLPKELMKKRARDTAKLSHTRNQPTFDNIPTTDRTVRTVESTKKIIKQAHLTEKGGRTTAKSTINTAQKSIKTAEKAAKITVKTTQRTARATQKTAQVAHTTTKSTAAVTKVAVKAAQAFVKAAIAATKALISAIAAGGWVAVAVILMICMVALLVCSVFGIFFSSEDGLSENGMTMRAVVSQINTEFAGELARIQRENPHDTCDITANRALWKEVLAVYAVKTNTGADNPLDVITLDDEKIGLLSTVFWDMNIIDYWIEEIRHSRTWYEYILHLTVTGKTASEMAEQYGFNAEQRDLLEELLRPEYDELWASLLTGVPSGGSALTVSLGIYIWPSNDSNYVTSFFGTRVHPVYGDVRHHNGVDIGAANGTEVLAAADGTVTLAGWNGSYGNCVIIDHGSGNQTLYAHMSRLNVNAGQMVMQGQVIGFVGSTGTSTGPHLHFETYVNGSRVDPLLYFDQYTTAW